MIIMLFLATGLRSNVEFDGGMITQTCFVCLPSLLLLVKRDRVSTDASISIIAARSDLVGYYYNSIHRNVPFMDIHRHSYRAYGNA